MTPTRWADGVGRLPMPGREIVVSVAGLNRVRADDLTARGRRAGGVAFARAEAAYLLNRRLGWSWCRVGRLLGGISKEGARKAARRYERMVAVGLDAAAGAFE